MKKPLDRAKKRCSDLVSKITRIEARGQCYTCPTKKHWKEMHGGHFLHGKLDYDLRNRRCQCFTCNHYHSGRREIFAIKLIKEKGMEWVDQLVLDSNQVDLKKLDDYLEIEKVLKIKLAELQNEVC